VSSPRGDGAGGGGRCSSLVVMIVTGQVIILLVSIVTAIVMQMCKRAVSVTAERNGEQSRVENVESLELIKSSVTID